MRLYIANTTKQWHDFTYRLPEEKNLRVDRIGPGKQAWIGGTEFTRDICHKIVSDYAGYNLRGVQELGSTKGYVGLVYSFDKPVPLDNIIERIENNDEALDEQATDRLEDAAAAIAAQTQERVREAGVRVTRTEVELTEDTKGEPTINKGFEILAEGVEPRHGGRQGRRARRANA